MTSHPGTGLKHRAEEGTGVEGHKPRGAAFRTVRGTLGDSSPRGAFRTLPSTLGYEPRWGGFRTVIVCAVNGDASSLCLSLCLWQGGAPNSELQRHQQAPPQLSQRHTLAPALRRHGLASALLCQGSAPALLHRLHFRPAPARPRARPSAGHTVGVPGPRSLPPRSAGLPWAPHLQGPLAPLANTGGTGAAWLVSQCRAKHGGEVPSGRNPLSELRQCVPVPGVSLFALSPSRSCLVCSFCTGGGRALGQHGGGSGARDRT